MRMVSGYGQYCDEEFYFEISHDDVKNMIHTPSVKPKASSQWVLPSSLMTRHHDQQRKDGQFSMLWVDIDKSGADLTFDALHTYILMYLPGVEAWMYQTSSWTPEAPKYRVMFPLDSVLSGVDYVRHQKALVKVFKEMGIKLDTSAARVGQVCFLPNVTDESLLSVYRGEIIEGGSPVEILAPYVEAIVLEEERLAIEHKMQALARAEKRKQYSDSESPFEVYNSSVDLRQVMVDDYGYVATSEDDYKSVYQSSPKGSTRVWFEGEDAFESWSSLSESDAESGLGTPSKNGDSIFGDAFAMLKHYKFGGDEKEAIKWVVNNVKSPVDGTTMAERETKAKAMKMFEDVKNMDRPIPPATVDEMGCPEILNLEDIKLSATGGYTGDHIADGLTAINSIWGGSRLCKMEGVLYWYNGAAWIATSDTILRRQMMLTMMSTDPKVKLKHAHFEGLLKSVKDLKMDEGQPNPASELIFFKNGVYDIDTGVMMPHDPKYRNTGTLSVVYNPNASGFAWLNWLKDIFEDDLERIDLLQEMIGWSLISGNLNIHKAMLLVGVQRSGKSTIADILDALLGSRVTGFTLNQLHNPKTLVGCIQATLAIDSEAGGPSKADAGVCREAFKKVSANDSVSITRLYVDGTTKTKLNCKLMAMANEVPQMFDNSNATNDRWAPLVFTKSFIGREDTGLRDRLLKDLEFVAHWAIEGLIRLKRNKNFTMPQTSKNEMNALRISGNPVSEFIDDVTVVGEGETCYKSEVWDRYRLWCEINGDKKPESRNTFYKNFHSALRSAGVEPLDKVRVRGGPSKGGFKGVSIRQPLHSVK